jgi:hypothetical protein
VSDDESTEEFQWSESIPLVWCVIHSHLEDGNAVSSVFLFERRADADDLKAQLDAAMEEDGRADDELGVQVISAPVIGDLSNVDASDFD